MDGLFGVPVEAFATGLAVVMAVAVGLIAVAALRNRVFLRMAAATSSAGGAARR